MEELWSGRAREEVSCSGFLVGIGLAVAQAEAPTLRDGRSPPPVSRRDRPPRGQTCELREPRRTRPGGEAQAGGCTGTAGCWKETAPHGPCPAPDAEERETTRTLLPASG